MIYNDAKVGCITALPKPLSLGVKLSSGCDFEWFVGWRGKFRGGTQTFRKGGEAYETVVIVVCSHSHVIAFSQSILLFCYLEINTGESSVQAKN